MVEREQAMSWCEREETTAPNFPLAAKLDTDSLCPWSLLPLKRMLSDGARASEVSQSPALQVRALACNHDHHQLTCNYGDQEGDQGDNGARPLPDLREYQG